MIIISNVALCLLDFIHIYGHFGLPCGIHFFLSVSIFNGTEWKWMLCVLKLMWSHVEFASQLAHEQSAAKWHVSNRNAKTKHMKLEHERKQQIKKNCAFKLEISLNSIFPCGSLNFTDWSPLIINRSLSH